MANCCRTQYGNAAMYKDYSKPAVGSAGHKIKLPVGESSETPMDGDAMFLGPDPCPANALKYEALRRRVEEMQPEVEAFEAAAASLFQRWSSLHASLGLSSQEVQPTLPSRGSVFRMEVSEMAATTSQDSNALIPFSARATPTRPGRLGSIRATSNEHLVIAHGNPRVPPSIKTASVESTGSENLGVISTGRKMFTGRTPSSALSLRDMWRELYLTNEVRADEQLESLHTEMSERDRDRLLPLRQFSDSLMPEGRFSLKGSKPKHWYTLCVGPWNPIGTGMLLWHTLGLVFVFVDLACIPFNIAWGRMSPVWLAIVTSCFWSLDALATLNTGFFTGGGLEMRRSQILKNYVMGWFVFDVGLLVLDWIHLASDFINFVDVRMIRTVRMNRLLRVCRITKIRHVVDDFCITQGQDWVIPVVTILQLVLLLLVTMHVFGCIWFRLGISLHEEGDERNWVTANNIQEREVIDQYFISVQWILSFIASSPQAIVPLNLIEYMYTIVIQIVSLIILGGAVSHLASTFQDLQARYQEVHRLRMSLRQYLVASRVPPALHQRILKFADHALQDIQGRPQELEPKVAGLLSQDMRVDLVVLQRERYLVVHPLMAVVHQSQTQVFRLVCETLSVQSFEEDCRVFCLGQWSQCLYITTSGTFRLYRKAVIMTTSVTLEASNSQYLVGSTKSSRLRNPLGRVDFETFSDNQCFCELALYANVTHQSTLISQTFTSVLTLSPSDLAECVSHSPLCILLIYEYAQELLKSAMDNGIDDAIPLEWSEDAVGATQLSKALGHHRSDAPNNKTRANIESGELSPTGASPRTGRAADCLEFIRRALAGDYDGFTLVMQVEKHIPELDPVDGVYVNLEEEEERSRAVASIVSVLEILSDRHLDFIRPQSEASRMTSMAWSTLRGLLVFEPLELRVVHALVLLLAIRGLGKAKKFLQLCPVQSRCTPESAITYAIDFMQERLPSMKYLGPQMQPLLRTVLQIQECFNFAQWLQAENTPWSILVFSNLVKSAENSLSLRFYLMYVVGIQAGILGHLSDSGSAFLTEHNSWNVIYGIQTLGKLHHLDPESLYWEFILLRVQHAGLRPVTDAQFAFSRLICLSRAWTQEDVARLQGAWEGLAPEDQQTLTKHMLADGIKNQALMFIFLPLFIVHATENPAVGLHLALTVLAELIIKLLAAGYVSDNSSMTVRVDLRDLANFTKEVKLKSNFALCLMHAKFRSRDTDEVRILMTAKNWQRMNDTMPGHSDVLPELARDVKQLLRKQTLLHESVFSPQVDTHVINMAR